MVERLGFIPALLLIPTRWHLRRDRDGRWLRSAEARVDGEIGNVAINGGIRRSLESRRCPSGPAFLRWAMCRRSTQTEAAYAKNNIATPASAQATPATSAIPRPNGVSFSRST